MQLLVPRRLNARSTAAQEAGQRAAIEAVRKFVDTVDEVIPALGDRPSRRETLIDAALDMADKLVTTQYEFLRSVVRSVDRSRRTEVTPKRSHSPTRLMGQGLRPLAHCHAGGLSTRARHRGCPTGRHGQALGLVVGRALDPNRRTSGGQQLSVPSAARQGPGGGVDGRTGHRQGLALSA